MNENPKVIEYVQSQLARAKSRLQPYVQQGPGFSYPQRFAFIRIRKYVVDFLNSKGDVPRWVIIPGLSGMGKTTILAQLYFQFLDKVDANHILYISLDDVVELLGSGLKDVLNAYETILGKSFEEQDRPVIIFVDETHRDPKWSSILNSVYNKAKNVFVVCSGSSAVLLQVQKEDLGRRTIFEKMYPLCFTEYLMIKRNIFPDPGLKLALKEAVYSSDSAKQAYEKLLKLKPRVISQWARIDKFEIDNYLSVGSLPYAAKRGADVPKVLMGIDTLLDKIISKDITTVGRFTPETIGVVKRLLYIMADTNDGLSINKTSEALGVSAVTLTNVLEILEKAELIVRVAPHGSKLNQLNQVKKPAKFLFMSPAIRRALLDVTGLESTFLVKRGYFLEDAVALHLYREFIGGRKGRLTYDTSQGSSDFILGIDNYKQLAIEVGIGDKGSQQVTSTMQKVKCDYGIIISDSQLLLVEEQNILKLPLEYFFMI